MVGKQISVTATAIGHEFSSSMKLAVLQLMTALFLYGNVNTSFLILQRNVSARMECWSLAVANTSSLNSHKPLKAAAMENSTYPRDSLTLRTAVIDVYKTLPL